jgi:hypothetical protein
MSAVREDVVHGLSDLRWKQFADLEELHRSVQANHERVIRSLDEAVVTDRRELQVAWNQYRQVVADLSRVTEEMESLRLGLA